MDTQSKIPRVRRTYNKWVANETLEDFALRFTAHKVRRFSSGRIANTAIGAISFLALEAIGGAITLNYGFSNAVTAILTVAAIIFLLGLPVSYYSAKYGVDIDLLTRGAGFGYIGSTITSLIYASFTFIFFAIEAAIVATALELTTGLPLSIGYVVSALVIIPLVTHGISFISRFQAWSQPLWIGLQLLPFIFLAAHGHPDVQDWTGYSGLLGSLDGSIDLTLFGAASAVLFSLVAQIGEQVDYLRFLPRKSRQNRVGWWVALLSAGPGWILIGALKMLAGSFLAFYAFKNGIPFEDASDPTRMYLVVYEQMFSSPEFALGLTGIFVVVCQLKINVTNTYAGSIAWSNFFSRLTHSHPGRVVWVVFNVALGLLLMEFGVYRALEQVLGLYAIVAVAWMACIVADLVINKTLGLAPKTIEFKRAHLYDINPVGFGSMLLSAVVALLAYMGFFGETIAPLYSYVALSLPFILVPTIALITSSKFYLARESNFGSKTEQQDHKCCICEHSFDHEDMAKCPVYRGNICSLCCSIDARCNDACKDNARFSEQVYIWADNWLPTYIANWIKSRFARYLTLFTIVTTITALVFGLVYFESTIDSSIPKDLLTATLTKLFAVTFIISGIVIWLFVLAQDSRKLVLEENTRQTKLLVEEIDAHGETDRQLKQAKEVAESANTAKSKYVVGLAHELRTPLNSILGYAQLLERTSDSNKNIRNAAGTIRRSGEHLSGLIEGLLDISKIEAGKIEIYRHKTVLRPFLDQLVDMFRLQAKNKSIDFEFKAKTPLPDHVYTDEKRLRQVLINLLSNAIKFTPEGHVHFSITYRNQTANFEIVDTGIGITDDDLEKIFLPFERGSEAVENLQPGTGLGLTITKLLVEIMGGELKVERLEVGTKFSAKFMLPSSNAPDENNKHYRAITGYEGPRRTVLVVDDAADQRALIREVLTPIGFNILEANSGQACLNMMQDTKPDLIMLDIAMPILSGWDVARVLREQMKREIPIIIFSADATEERNKQSNQSLYDAYLVKPFILDDLFDNLETFIPVTWIYAEDPVINISQLTQFSEAELPDASLLRQLHTLAQAGFVRSIEATLDELEYSQPETAKFCHCMRELAQKSKLDSFITAIEEVQHDD
ncbi:MAG: ATP-binding protein [Hyphomicrobiales bacterium]